MTDSSRTGRPDARTPRPPRPGGPRSDRTDRRSDDGRPAEREHTAELPKLADFTRKQFQQELMFRKGEIDNGIPELAGFHTDMIQSMLDTIPPIVLTELPRSRPVRFRPFIANDQTDDDGEPARVAIFDECNELQGRILVTRGLNRDDLTPVVSTDGLVLMFLYSDVESLLGHKFSRNFPGLTLETDDDDRKLYLLDEDALDFETRRRPSGSRNPRNPRRTDTPDHATSLRSIAAYSGLAFVLMILGGTVWHYLNTLLSLSGLLGFGVGAAFVLLPVLFVIYVYLGRHDNSASRPTNHSGSRRYDR